MRTDSCACFWAVGVYGDSIRRSIWIFIACNHLWKIEGLGQGGRHWCTYEAGGVADHESHFLGGHVGGSNNEVAFILAGEVIEDYYELAVFCSN